MAGDVAAEVALTRWQGGQGDAQGRGDVEAWRQKRGVTSR